MIEKINFYDEELSTFIFLQTDFSKVEFSPKIFFHIFSGLSIPTLLALISPFC